VPDQALVNSDLQSALAEVRQAYVAGNPKSFARHQEACEAMPGGNTRTTLHNSPFPLTVVRGEGCRLWDADGHEYIDVLGEYTAGIYGHSHPVIRAAIDRALNHGWNYGGRNANEAKLAKLVADRMPSIDLVRFTNSGTEGNVMALAGARHMRGRARLKVMVLMAATAYFVRAAAREHPHARVAHNDVGASGAVAGHGEVVAAAEPMQGARLPGCHVPPEDGMATRAASP
jgi:glutamate-1-semialdehyde 2,1-aminomutase